MGRTFLEFIWKSSLRPYMPNARYTLPVGERMASVTMRFWQI